MGDRCYMSVQCRAKDAQHFLEIGFEIEERIGNWVNLVDEQANYGHYGEMPEDVAHHSSATAGGDYDAEEAYQNVTGEFNSRILSDHSSRYAFIVDDEGNLEPNDKEDWLKFVRLRTEVEAYLDAAKDEDETEEIKESDEE